MAVRGERSSRTKKRRRAESPENRMAMLLITFVVCVMFGVLLMKGVQLHRQIDENERIRQELNLEIEAEHARTEEIGALKEYMQTEDYIRQAAKDRLGLVEEGEIVFRPAD